MGIVESIILAIVEGLTEFLPVSSTGHMIIAEAFLGIKSVAFVKAFTIIIQFGAILSVLVLYWKRFIQSLLFYKKLLIGFIPALVLGFLLGDYIDSLLSNVYIVAISLIVGGIIMLFVDKWFNSENGNSEITFKNAFVVGCFQCIAMIPGVSRSMATIFGGLQQKLSRKNAVEFSFFLAVPTIVAATGYKFLQLIREPGGVEILSNNFELLLIGNVVAFIVAMLSIKFFIGFITKNGFSFFGWYRIVVGVIILIALLVGFDLNIS